MEILERVKPIIRYQTASTITQLNYIKDAQLLSVSEANMFGFDWTGTLRLFTMNDLLSQKSSSKLDYIKNAWVTIEYEHGICTSEYFALMDNVFRPFIIIRFLYWQEAWMEQSILLS